FKLLQKALDEWGIGAKTSSGYGRLNVDGVGYAAPAAASTAQADAQASATQLQGQHEEAEQEIATWLKQTVSMDLEQLLDDGCIVKPISVTKLKRKGFVSSEHYGGRTPKEGQQMSCTVRGLIERNGEYLADLIWNQPKGKKKKG
ncbi:MAG: hypothetical protein HC911_17965, partial [Chloroflexaceae bacterium]|nr:hypothetical protein [Chloroflexaceae bacterium]